jgi:hypothetical protein
MFAPGALLPAPMKDTRPEVEFKLLEACVLSRARAEEEFAALWCELA